MFVKATNGTVEAYPYTVGQLRRDNPHTSFPKIVPEKTMNVYGMFSVGYEPAPEYDPLTHQLEHSNMPVLKDGKWVLTKKVIALTAEQIASNTAAKAKSVRSKRNALLADTDWRFRSDLTASQAWIDYCQALRDITAHASFPYLADTDWPVKP